MTRVALDTSVLVAGLVAAHPHHSRAVVWLEAVMTDDLEGTVCTHALGETWATLTAMPLRPRLGAVEAEAMLDRLLGHLTTVTCDAGLYRAAIRRCAEAGRSSGAIFDALHMLAAERASAAAILTLNRRDFDPLARLDGPTVAVPPDPPAVRLP